MYDKFPIIDINSKTFAEDYARAFRLIGFGGVLNHGISYDLIQAAEETQRAFCEQPYDVKQAFSADPITEIGWTGHSGSSLGATADLKEFTVLRPNEPHQMRILPSGFDYGPILDLAKEQEQLGVRIMQQLEPFMVQHCPQFAGIAEQLAGSNTTALRANYFPPYKDSDDPNAVPAAEHRDLGFLTVLSPAREGGLWASSRDCDRDAVADRNNRLYVPAFQPGDNHFFVTNIGEICSLFTGGGYDFFTGRCIPDGYFAATWHGVDKVQRSSATAARISLPLFMHLRPGTPLKRISQAELNAVKADPRLNEGGAFHKQRDIILEVVKAVEDHDGWLKAGMMVYNRLARHGYGKKMEL